MSGHQWLRVRVTKYRYVVVGTVDYPGKTKRDFYIKKMIDVLEKKGFMAKHHVVPPAEYHHGYVEILAKLPGDAAMAKGKPASGMKLFTGIAWVHPKGGGDDFQIRVRIEAKNLTEAKRELRAELLRKWHTNKNMVNDFSIKEAK